MTNRHGMPVLDRAAVSVRRTLVEPPKPQSKTVDERESSVALVLNRCASGCRRAGIFRFAQGDWCECCISAEIVRSER